MDREIKKKKGHKPEEKPEYQAGGFSLIEAVIVLGVIAILAAITYPSYRDHVLATRRSDAYIALTLAAAEQERFYLLNNAYSAAIELPGGGLRSPEGFYQLDVALDDAGGYRLTAEAVADGAQAHDRSCLRLTLDHLGIKAPAECW